MALARRKIDYDGVVIHRNVSFDLNTDTVPRYWFANDPWLTHWMNAIFGSVPVGERFVMKATRKQLDKLSDPSIHKAAIAFIKQEGSHAKAHDGLNEVLTAHGMPVKQAQTLTKLVFDAYENYLPDMMKFAFSATGEHFTATLSSAMLEQPELWDETPDEVAALAFWHFVEEIEHKSVSFDIYKNSSGDGLYSYAVLMATLALGVSTLTVAAHMSWLYLVWKDRQITNVRSAFKAAKSLLFKPGLFTRTFVFDALPFLSPTFHPWDHDNREMINVWKDSYEKTGDPVQAYRDFRAWHDARTRSGNTAAARAAA